MKVILLVVLMLTSLAAIAEQSNYRLDLSISVNKALAPKHQPKGRLFVFLSTNPKDEPRQQLWPIKTQKNYIFAHNLDTWTTSKAVQTAALKDWQSTADFDLNNIPAGEYFLQVLWDQNNIESSINATGNVYSVNQTIRLDKDQTLAIELDQRLNEAQMIEHPLVRAVELPSALLSEFWGEPRSVKFSVLLPRSYHEQPEQRYYSRYNISGYGGRYHRLNRLMQNPRFADWWQSAEAPEVINIFLDGDGPLGDSYQLDSANSGPYGQVLIKEIIPYVEANFRAFTGGEYRFADGCSTGGWVSLALQIFYPDEFNGIWSYSPDAVEFTNYQTINLYKDENFFTNEWGNLRPIARDVSGDIMITVKDFVRLENVLGPSNTFVDSGFQLGAHAALYGPRGDNGLPVPVFDSVTGAIDKSVVEYWQRYDLQRILQQNWSTLGPKLAGKLYVWMGDMDHFYLNAASRSLADYLANTTEPKSDAQFEFAPMTGHCSVYSNTRVLGQIAERIRQLESQK